MTESVYVLTQQYLSDHDGENGDTVVLSVYKEFPTFLEVCDQHPISTEDYSKLKKQRNCFSGYFYLEVEEFEVNG